MGRGGVRLSGHWLGVALPIVTTLLVVLTAAVRTRELERLKEVAVAATDLLEAGSGAVTLLAEEGRS